MNASGLDRVEYLKLVKWWHKNADQLLADAKYMQEIEEPRMAIELRDRAYLINQMARELKALLDGHTTWEQKLR